MKTAIIRSLVRKDLRINASALAIGLLMWLAPYGILSLYRLLAERQTGAPMPGSWQRDLGTGAYLSLIFTNFTALLMGAGAFATERSDRSAEFLAILPATRRQIVGSKLLVALVPLAVIWAVDFAVIVGFRRYLPDPQRGLPVEAFAPVAAATLMAFGVSWFGSSILDRPMNALGLALLVAFVVMQGAWLAAWLLPGGSNYWVATVAYAVLVLLGLTGFVAGTWIALRRVEP